MWDWLIGIVWAQNVQPQGGSLELTRVVEWLWAVVLLVCGIVGKQMYNKIEQQLSDLREDHIQLRDSKADKQEFDRMREHINDIFTRLGDTDKTLVRVETKLDVLLGRNRRGDPQT